MTRLLVSTFALATLLVSARPAAAESITATYDTIEEVTTRASNSILITGIRVGDSTPTTTSYTVGPSAGGATEVVVRCDRLALLAMAKPGKFQFLIVNEGLGALSCRLRVRTP